MDIKTLLKKDEGLSLTPYKDIVGKMTIGYGRNLEDNGITLEEADLMLETDLKKCIVNLTKEIPWFSWLDEVRRAVLISLAFNVGISGALKFKKTLNFMRNKDYFPAAEELLDSDAAKLLPKRYLRLAKMLETGKWPQ